jgi:hypothetical protein
MKSSSFGSIEGSLSLGSKNSDSNRGSVRDSKESAYSAILNILWGFI